MVIVNIMTKTGITNLVDSKIRKEMEYLYKELNNIRYEIEMLNELIKLKKGGIKRDD